MKTFPPLRSVLPGLRCFGTRGHDDQVRVIGHDGSFPGFLCAAAQACEIGLAGGAIPEVRAISDEPDLFGEVEEVSRDDDRAFAFWNRVLRRSGGEAMHTILAAFCSDLPQADRAAARMLSRLLAEGSRVLDDLASPEARSVEKAAHRTLAEAHRLTGLARFSELADGSWYAPMEPDCDVLALIADHFAARFPVMRWAIHDTRRNKAIIHEAGASWRMVSGFRLVTSLRERIDSSRNILPEGADRPDGTSGTRPFIEGCLEAVPDTDENIFSAEEIRLRELWSRYFSSVSITERANSRLQSGHMPKKYWKNLPETYTGLNFSRSGH